MDLRIAITGGIACGKSLFSRFLCEMGVEVLDADEVVHRLESPGGAAVTAIRAVFGDRVVRADGSVDRAVLGGLVFGDGRARERLNAVVHPLVRREIGDWLARPSAAGRLRAVVIPLLFEAGWERDWDVIICVVSSEAVQVERLVSQRGLTVAQARERLAAQMPVAEKAARSHFVVRNEADAAALAAEAARAYRFLIERSE